MYFYATPKDQLSSKPLIGFTDVHRASLKQSE